MTNLTEQFAEALLDWDPMGPEALEQARLLVLDGLAVACAGVTQPGPTIMSSAVKSYAGAGSSTVIGRGFKTAPHLAARLNGMSMHVLDYEPMWHPANHAISPTLSALLALAEVQEEEGKGPRGASMFGALTKALEVQGRLRLASGQIEVKDLKLHPPGVVGTIASAAGAAVMLGLGVKETVAAIGIAASRSAGLLCNAGTMTKALHCGDAACNGLEAALLAAEGFSAAADPLGDPRGYGRSYFPETFDPSFISAPLGTPRSLDPGPAWKFFPSQYATHYCITAALECASKIPDPIGSIAKIEVISPDIPYLNRPNPDTGLDGKFSYQYCATVALLDGRVDMGSFHDARRFSPDVTALLDRVFLTVARDTRGVFTEMTVEVRVTLNDGSMVGNVCAAPLGNWANPASPKQVEEKAESLLQAFIGSNNSRAAMELIRGNVNTLCVRDLTLLFSDPMPS